MTFDAAMVVVADEPRYCIAASEEKSWAVPSSTSRLVRQSKPEGVSRRRHPFNMK
jgi:hypothetical protein